MTQTYLKKNQTDVTYCKSVNIKLIADHNVNSFTNRIVGKYINFLTDRIVG